MNNAWTGTWRSVCSGFRSAAFSTSAKPIFQSRNSPIIQSVLAQVGSCSLRSSRWAQSYTRPFSTTSICEAAKRSPPSIPKRPVKLAKDEAAFRPTELSLKELAAIFGHQQVFKPSFSPQLANRILRVLHARRLAGTLDLDLPKDVDKAVSNVHVWDDAVNYLRRNYPVDEDAAILARIEEEEARGRTENIEAAERLGLYKPRDGNDSIGKGVNENIYGPSVLEQVRMKNEAIFKQQEEEKARLKKVEEEKLERAGTLQRHGGSDVASAEDDASRKNSRMWKWREEHAKRATSELTPDSPELKIPRWRRIMPSTIFTAAVIALCYLFAQNYVPPLPTQRLWPEIPPAAATCAGLIMTNMLIFFAWSLFPPAWRFLNRYFITVSAYPYAASTLGNIFSHQSLSHITFNMFLLWFVGVRLHEDVGRGNFLAIYIASGVFASWVSLAHLVARNSIVHSSLGASGAVSGILAAWCVINKDQKFTLRFVPEDWQKYFTATAGAFLATFITIEILAAAFLGMARTKTDHGAHLGGYTAGIVAALFWQKNHPRRSARLRGGSRPGFLDRVIGKQL